MFKFHYQNGQKKKKKYKSGQGFHIGAKRFEIWAEITNRGKGDFKMGQGKILTHLCLKFETSAHEQIVIVRCWMLIGKLLA